MIRVARFGRPEPGVAGNDARKETNKIKITTMNTTYSAADLFQKTGAELTAIYNDLTGETVKKFPSKDVAIKRILQAQETAKKIAESKAEKAEKEANIFNRKPLATQRPFRTTSPRGRLITAMLKGATLEELKKEVPEYAEKLRHHILNSNSWHGYGLRQDGDKIFAFVD